MSPNAPLVLAISQSAGENDCFVPVDLHQFPSKSNYACADAPGLLQNQREPGLAAHNHANHLFAVKLNSNFHLAMSPNSPNGPVVMNQVAWNRWQTFTSPGFLTENIDYELAQHQLIQPVGEAVKHENRQLQTLVVWLHVTNACDLDCPYCYVRKSSERMSEETGRKAIKAVFNTAVSRNFRHVKLKYAGGEATLHFKMIRKLHQMAQQLSIETGIRLSAVVLSNGVNLRFDDAAWLKENDVRLMISLDGVGELHDKLRLRKNGTGTFDKIAHNIDHKLLPQGIRPFITMTITHINAHGAADLARWAIIERGLPVNFNLYRQNLLSASRQELALEEDTIINSLKAAYAVIEQAVPAEPILGGLLDRVQVAAHAHTCGVGQNYAVITHKGQLTQCHMRLNDSIPLSDNLLVSQHTHTIHNISVDEKEGCRDCTFRYRCTGGCPLETFRATGRWDVKSPHCRIYKTLLPEVLRLQGLQIIKSNGLLLH